MLHLDAALASPKPLRVTAPLTSLKADKVASATVPLQLETELQVGPLPHPRSGDVVVVRTLTDSATYDKLELRSGRLARLNPQDVVVGVLGARRALKGFVGEVPTHLSAGD